MSDLSPSVRFIEVEEDSEGQRIDNFLVKSLKGVPKSKIYRCVRKGEVRVNGGRVKAPERNRFGYPGVPEREQTIRTADNGFGLIKLLLAG